MRACFALHPVVGSGAISRLQRSACSLVQDSVFWDICEDAPQRVQATGLRTSNDYSVMGVAQRCQDMLTSLAQLTRGLTDSVISAGCVQLFKLYMARKSLGDVGQQAVLHLFVSETTVDTCLRALFDCVEMKAKGTL